jgi:hypothetical protein
MQSPRHRLGRHRLRPSGSPASCDGAGSAPSRGQRPQLPRQQSCHSFPGSSLTTSWRGGVSMHKCVKRWATVRVPVPYRERGRRAYRFCKVREHQTYNHGRTQRPPLYPLSLKVRHLLAGVVPLHLPLSHELAGYLDTPLPRPASPFGSVSSAKAFSPPSPPGLALPNPHVQRDSATTPSNTSGGIDIDLAEEAPPAAGGN